MSLSTRLLTSRGPLEVEEQRTTVPKRIRRESTNMSRLRISSVNTVSR